MLPCTKIIGFIEEGFKDLGEKLSRAQLMTLMMAATCLVLGCPFNLSQMARGWLLRKSVNAFWYLMNLAKIQFVTVEEVRLKLMQKRYGKRLRGGRFIIDDTMNHHSRLCCMIHAVFTFWDHALGTHLKAQCIVFLYYQEAETIKFPLGWRLYKKEGKAGAGKEKERQLARGEAYQEKYTLALELIDAALAKGFKCRVVLADSWYCIEKFMKALRTRNLAYIFELKENRQVEVSIPLAQRIEKACGRKRTKWYNLVSLEEFFRGGSVRRYGFARDLETGQAEKVLYEVQETVVRMHAYAGQHKVVRSLDPRRQTIKYLITDELSWDAVKVITEYLARWVVEEFFRNAKQLLDMEGACVRSKQGVALALFLVTYVDSLLHWEVDQRRRASKNSQSGPVTVQSIIRLAQLENVENFIAIVEDEDRWVPFRNRWLAALKKYAIRERKMHKPLVEIAPPSTAQEPAMAMG